MGRHAGPHLTQSQVDALPFSTGKAIDIHDGKVRGLHVRVNQQRKAYRMKLSLKGAGMVKVQKDGSIKPKDVEIRTIGFADEIDLEEARRRAQIALGETLTKLGDTEKMRREARLEGVTLQWAWDRYIQECKFPHGRDQKPCTPNTIAHYETVLRLYFDGWKHKKVVDLARDREGYKTHYRKLEERGKYAARSADKVFRIVWADLKRTFPELPDCPANVLGKRDKAKVQKRQIGYRPDELANVMPYIWRAGRFRAGLQYFLMLSGCRATGVKTALRSDYNRERGTLMLRHHKGKEHEIPLSAAMISLLDAMITLGESLFPDNPYIFCAFSKAGHITSAVIEAPPSEALAAHRAKTGKGQDDEIGTHLWRNTWVSLAPLAGLSARDARQMIGHSTGEEDAHEGYATAILSHLRAQQERMSDYLLTHAGLGADHRFAPSHFSGVRELDAIDGLISGSARISPEF